MFILKSDEHGVCCVVSRRPTQGGRFGKLAVLAKDTKALADKVSASGGSKKVGGGEVLFAGAVPGIGTKVRFLCMSTDMEDSVVR